MGIDANQQPLRKLNHLILLGEEAKALSLLEKSKLYSRLCEFDDLQLSPIMYTLISGCDFQLPIGWMDEGSRNRNRMGFCYDDLFETLNPQFRFTGLVVSLIYPPVTLSILSATSDILIGRAVSRERFEHILDLSKDKDLVNRYFVFLAMYRNSLETFLALMVLSDKLPDQSLDAIPPVYRTFPDFISWYGLWLGKTGVIRAVERRRNGLSPKVERRVLERRRR